MKNVFITSTLKSEWNVTFNQKICDALEAKGISCHLPQRDTNQQGTPAEKFQQNADGVKAAQMNLCVAMNESPNFGGEVGYAYGLEKPIIALTQTEHDIPLMLNGMVTEVVAVEDLMRIDAYIDELVALIEKYKS